MRVIIQNSQNHGLKILKKTKNGILSKQKMKYENNKTFTKNPFGYVFHNFDKILRLENQFLSFWAKNAHLWEYFTKKTQI